MQERKEAWYRNPFRLGLFGLLILLAGYALLASRPPGSAEPGSLGVLGRVGFLVGVLVTLAAGVQWFLDARAPEESPDEVGNDELTDG